MIKKKTNAARLVKSPCVRNCCLNDDDLCLGCFRCLDEIIQWGAADDILRNSILEKCQKRRQAYETKWHK